MRAAASMWRLLLPTEIRSSGDGSSFNVELQMHGNGEVGMKEGRYWCYCRRSKCWAINVWGRVLQPIKTYGWHSLKIDRLQHWNIICWKCEKLKCKIGTGFCLRWLFRGLSSKPAIEVLDPKTGKGGSWFQSNLGFWRPDNSSWTWCKFAEESKCLRYLLEIEMGECLSPFS